MRFETSPSFILPVTRRRKEVGGSETFVMTRLVVAFPLIAALLR